MRIGSRSLSRAFLAAVGTLASAQVSLAYDSVVTVDAAMAKATIASTGFGIHTSVYDNRLTHSSVPTRLNSAGITVLRYPGGGYADAYHWSENRNTSYFDTGNLGYIAANADFGSVAKMVAAMPNGRVMITVNYGSSLQGDSGGEPKEAAAWVAYCNGAPASTQAIGVDSRGNDWRTVGYWASLRAAQPLAIDDGKNFLRIGHSASLNCQLWEIGNELFGNGFYGFQIENDWHASYSVTRTGLAALSPVAVGNNVRAYVTEMKAVDPTIQIGVPVSNPPHDDTWGPQWDQALLQACGDVIQFVAIHDYAGFYLPPNFNTKDPADVLLKSGPDRLAETVSLMRTRINTYAGGNAPNVRIAVTEANGNPLAAGWEFTNTLLAANVYAGFLANGVINVDWLELHAEFLTDDDSGTPKGPYSAVQLVNLLMAPGDQAVTTTSSNSLLATHASHKTNGDLGLLLVNTSPTDVAVANITISEFVPQSSGTLYSLDRDSSVYSTSNQNGLSTAFVVNVPAYSIRQIMLSPAAVVVPDFSLSSGGTVSVTQGANAHTAITITRTNFQNSVDMTAIGLPVGVSVSFSPASTTTNSIATFTAASNATTGTATVTLTGTSGGMARSTTLTLVVVAAPAPSPTGSGGGGGGGLEIMTLFLLASLLVEKALAQKH